MPFGRFLFFIFYCCCYCMCFAWWLHSLLFGLQLHSRIMQSAYHLTFNWRGNDLFSTYIHTYAYNIQTRVHKTTRIASGKDLYCYGTLKSCNANFDAYVRSFVAHWTKHTRILMNGNLLWLQESLHNTASQHPARCVCVFFLFIAPSLHCCILISFHPLFRCVLVDSAMWTLFLGFRLHTLCSHLQLRSSYFIDQSKKKRLVLFYNE